MSRWRRFGWPHNEWTVAAAWTEGNHAQARIRVLASGRWCSDQRQCRLGVRPASAILILILATRGGCHDENWWACFAGASRSCWWNPWGRSPACRFTAPLSRHLCRGELTPSEQASTGRPEVRPWSLDVLRCGRRGRPPTSPQRAGVVWAGVPDARAGEWAFFGMPHSNQMLLANVQIPAADQRSAPQRLKLKNLQRLRDARLLCFWLLLGLRSGIPFTES